MNRRHFAAGCGAGLLTLATAFGDAPKEPPLTAQEVLDRMAKAYATCATYRDTGTVRVSHLSGGVEVSSERPFSTAFVRPDRFRFEFTARPVAGQAANRYVVWRHGRDVKTSWDLRPGAGKPIDLEDAVSGCKGVSGRASHTVPALLLPKEIYKSLTALADLKRLDDARLGRRDCFRLGGVYVLARLSLWIDKESLLLRQMEERQEFPQDLVVTTATYDPTADGEVAAKLLEFEPAK